MPTPPRRPRQPEFLRAALISAAAELLAEGSPVSIGSVADAAGVSKGAVQHHFASREDLFIALYDELCTEFEASQALERGDSSPAWTYARPTMQGDPDTDTSVAWKALLVALVANRELARRWSGWVAQDRQRDGVESTDQLIARLAADGLWLSDLLGIYRLTAEERGHLANRVHQLAEKAPQ